MQRARHLLIRLRAIEIMGGACVQCGFSDWRGLQIDHIYGGGTSHRKKKTHHMLYREIRKTGTYEGLQLLCANCNQIKRYEVEIEDESQVGYR